MFTEIFQTILLVRQKDFVDTFSADHLDISYELRPKKHSSIQMSVIDFQKFQIGIFRYTTAW
jgi:hypothetical protein